MFNLCHKLDTEKVKHIDIILIRKSFASTGMTSLQLLLCQENPQKNWSILLSSLIDAAS